MFHYMTNIYEDTAEIEYQASLSAHPELSAYTELFKDIDSRGDYAKPFREVIEIILDTKLPKAPKKSHKPYIGALVYIKGTPQGIGVVLSENRALSNRGSTSYNLKHLSGTLLPLTEIDKFFFCLRSNRTVLEEDGTAFFNNVDTGYKFDWRKGLVGSGRFKKEWAEQALKAFSEGIYSPFVTDGLTEAKLYSILEESNDDSFACRLLMEALLEQITEETPTTEA